MLHLELEDVGDGAVVDEVVDGGPGTAPGRLTHHDTRNRSALAIRRPNN